MLASRARPEKFPGSGAVKICVNAYGLLLLVDHRIDLCDTAMKYLAGISIDFRQHFLADLQTLNIQLVNIQLQVKRIVHADDCNGLISPHELALFPSWF